MSLEKMATDKRINLYELKQSQKREKKKEVKILEPVIQVNLIPKDQDQKMVTEFAEPIKKDNPPLIKEGETLVEELDINNDDKNLSLVCEKILKGEKAINELFKKDI